MTSTPIASASRAAMPSELVYAAFSAGDTAGGLGPNAQALVAQLRAGKESLPAQAIAIGLWQLREARVISLDIRKGKTLGFIPTTSLVTTLVGNTSSWAGIEGELLAKLVEKGSRGVETLVGDWYGKKAAVSPQHVALGRLRDKAFEAGIVEKAQVEANRGFIGRAVLGDTREAVVPNEEALAAAMPALEQLAAGWTAFTQREPELAKELLARVEKAIDSKEMSDSGGSDGPDFD